uniref:Uncharacterized protein n=1 Tax=Vespula pensylvanica TaxID=30213 RepID=A0A834UGZ2_VESPE|nr:hypothetical protein H0235_000993 [Vespula pensylvanica]
MREYDKGWFIDVKRSAKVAKEGGVEGQEKRIQAACNLSSRCRPTILTVLLDIEMSLRREPLIPITMNLSNVKTQSSPECGLPKGRSFRVETASRDHKSLTLARVSAVVYLIGHLVAPSRRTSTEEPLLSEQKKNVSLSGLRSSETLKRLRIG